MIDRIGLKRAATSSPRICLLIDRVVIDDGRHHQPSARMRRAAATKRPATASKSASV